MLGQSEFNVLVDSRAASQDHAGRDHRDHRRGRRRLRRSTTDDADGGAPPGEHFGIVQDFRTLGEYFERLETRSRPAINLGHVRRRRRRARTMSSAQDDRPATPAELEQMKELVAQAMEDGALGLSTSLQYVPGPLRVDRRARRAGEGGAPVRRHLHHAPALREPARSTRRWTRSFRIAREARTSPPRSGTSRPRIRPTGAACPRCWRGSRRRAPRGSTSRPTSTRTRARRTASTRACRSGCARAARTRMWRG